MNREEYRTHYFTPGLQRDWNTSRLTKLKSILGPDWFQGKSVLDVGCGHGDNGKSLMELGAHVTFTDGRPVHIDVLKLEGHNAFVMDQEAPWSITGMFDLIVHWGVSYHLSNWKQDLRCAFEHAPLICFETEICDTDDPMYENKTIERTNLYDQALSGEGTTISAAHLESFVTSLGGSFVRYDDPALDSGIMRYSWKPTNNGAFTSGQRRFWMLSREGV